MRRDLVGDNAVFDVFFIRQTEVFFRRDVAEHGRAVPANHGGADGGGDVIVAGRDVGGQRTQRVERSFVTGFELPIHVFFDQVHRDVTRAFDHHLTVVLPRDFGQ